MWYIVPENEIYHHGILGQKWGKRNGPPYPLGSGDHSAREKKAGWQKSLDKGKSDSYNKKKKTKSESESKARRGLTDGQKRALKIGAAAVAAGLAAYGGYKLYQSGKLDPTIASLAGKGRESAGSQLEDFNDSPWDQLQGEDLQLLNDLQRRAFEINETSVKRYMDSDWDALLYEFQQLPEENRHNCGQCTMAGIANYFGINAIAKGDSKKSQIIGTYKDGNPIITNQQGMSKSIFESCFSGAKQTRSDVKSADDIISYIKSQPDRSTGALFLMKGKWFHDDGHIVQWVNISGVPVIIDNQTGMVGGVKSYLKKLGKTDVLKGQTTLLRKAFSSSGIDAECSIYSISEKDMKLFSGTTDFNDFMERR